MSLCASVYMCFVVTCWERADLLALVCGVYCEFVTFPLVSWVRCGTWLYRFLIFAPLLTLEMASTDDIGTAAKLYTTLYRRIMSALCCHDCSEGHCREEMMEETLSGWWGLNRRPATNLAALRWTCSICLILVCCWGFKSIMNTPVSAAQGFDMLYLWLKLGLISSCVLWIHVSTKLCPCQFGNSQTIGRPSNQKSVNLY